MSSVTPQAKYIGDEIMQSRLAHGYASRASLVETRKIKGKLSQEGLRKIEHGERIPRLENIQLLCEVLGISKRKTKEMEQLALEANVQRVTRRAGNATVTVEINGKPMKLLALPPKRRTEAFVRELVSELVAVVGKYGVMDADVDHFRRHARSALLRKLAA